MGSRSDAHILEMFQLQAAMEPCSYLRDGNRIVQLMSTDLIFWQSRNNIAVSLYVLLSVAISQVDNNLKDFLRATSYIEPWCLNVVEHALSLFDSPGIKSKQSVVAVNWEERSNADLITIVIRYLLWFSYIAEAFMRAGLIIHRAVVSYKNFFYMELQDYRWPSLEVELQMSCRKRVYKALACLMFLQEFKINALALALPCFDFEDGNTSHRDQIVGDELVTKQLILFRCWLGIVLPLYDLMGLEKLDEGEYALKAMPSDGILLGANGGSRIVIVTLLYYFQKEKSKLVFDPGGSTFAVLIFKDIEGVFEAFVKAVATLFPYNAPSVVETFIMKFLKAIVRHNTNSYLGLSQFGYAYSEVTDMSESPHVNLLARVYPQFPIFMFNSYNDLWNQQTTLLQNLVVLNSGRSIVMNMDNSYIAYGLGPVIWTEVGQTIRPQIYQTTRHPIKRLTWDPDPIRS